MYNIIILRTNTVPSIYCYKKPYTPSPLTSFSQLDLVFLFKKIKLNMFIYISYT